MGLCGVALMFLGRPLTSVISSEAVHMAIVPKLLFICGATQIFFAIMTVVGLGFIAKDTMAMSNENKKKKEKKEKKEKKDKSIE